MYIYKEKPLSNELQKKINKAISELPEMSMEETNLGDEKNQKGKTVFWCVKNTNIGAFITLIGSHFRVQMTKISNGSFLWIQPFIYPLMKFFPTTTGKKRANTGFIGLIKSGSSALLVIGNEPGAEKIRKAKKIVHPAFRPPFQASLQKMKDIRNGKEEKDPILLKIFEYMPATELERMDWFPTNLGDSNKYVSRVWKTIVEVSWQELLEIHSKIETSVILSIDEMKELIIKRPDLFNSHGLEVIAYMLALYN